MVPRRSSFFTCGRRRVMVAPSASNTRGENMKRVPRGRGGRCLLALVAAIGVAAIVSSGAAGSRGDDQLAKINHIVVIYEENHSFDNLYGGWEGVNGRASADAAHTLQVNEAGNTYKCLLQNDVNLTSPPLP